MATIVASATGGNWNMAAAWVGGVVPTAVDDVQLVSTSGNITITAGAACKSLDCTGYTRTLLHPGNITLSIGSSTPGLGNVALKLVSGMTYTLGSTITSAISFVSTSATTQTIETGGKILANWAINGPGSSYQLVDSNTTTTSAIVTLTAGSLNTNGQACDWGGFSASATTSRSLTLGSSTITVRSNGWICATNTNMTFNAGTSTLIFAIAGVFNGGIHFSYNNLVFNGSGMATITSSGGFGTGTIANLTRTGTASKLDVLFINTTPTITGTLTLNGHATSRLIVRSNVAGSLHGIIANGNIVASNVDFMDIHASGSASWDLSAIPGGSGDCGGNLGITFTPPATQTWQGTSGGNWSDISKWTSRVPLPQDNVVINAAFSPGQTINADMWRLGRHIDWTGSTGSPTWALAQAVNVFGSLTLVSGMTISGAHSLSFYGRGGCTLTTNNVPFPSNVAFDPGPSTVNKYTLQDALTLNSGTLYVGSNIISGANRGYLDATGKTITCPAVQLGSVSVSGSLFLFANGTLNLTSTAAGAILSLMPQTVGSLVNTFTADGSVVNIVNASANDRTVVAHGFALDTLNYTVAGSTGRLLLGTTGATGTMTIGTLNFSDASNARTLQIWAGTTIAIANNFNVQGAAGRLISIVSSTNGASTTLTKAAGSVNCDYLSLRDSTATGGASWYAGYNSTNVSNNSGWFFTAANTGAFLSFR